MECFKKIEPGLQKPINILPNKFPVFQSFLVFPGKLNENQTDFKINANYYHEAKMS